MVETASLGDASQIWLKAIDALKRISTSADVKIVDVFHSTYTFQWHRANHYTFSGSLY